MKIRNTSVLSWVRMNVYVYSSDFWHLWLNDCRSNELIFHWKVKVEESDGVAFWTIKIKEGNNGIDHILSRYVKLIIWNRFYLFILWVAQLNFLACRVTLSWLVGTKWAWTLRKQNMGWIWLLNGRICRFAEGVWHHQSPIPQRRCMAVTQRHQRGAFRYMEKIGQK